MSGGGERDRLSGASKQGGVWVSCLLGVIFPLSTAAQVLHWRALPLLSEATGIPVSASPCLPSELLCRILSLRILSIVLWLWLWRLLALTGSITSTTSSSLFFFFFPVFSICHVLCEVYSLVPWRQYCVISSCR